MRGRLSGALVVGVWIAGCGPAPLEPREPTPGVPHFTIATFNVHYPTRADAATVGAVGGTRADVILLQEVDDAWRRALNERYSADYPYTSYFVDQGPRGLAVLSRFPLESSELLPAPADWHPAQRVVAQTPAGALQILHVHLRSRFEGESNPVQNYVLTSPDHVRELDQFLTASPDLPTLIAGDFNEEPDGGALDWLSRRGYRNVLPLYHPGQGTWSGPSVAGQLSITIDHVLFGSSLVSLNAWVADGGNSDHQPVVAHFEAARPLADADQN